MRFSWTAKLRPVTFLDPFVTGLNACDPGGHFRHHGGGLGDPEEAADPT